MSKKGLYLILIISVVVGIASADTGGYIVSPCPPQEELDKLGDAVDMNGRTGLLHSGNFLQQLKSLTY